MNTNIFCNTPAHRNKDHRPFVKMNGSIHRGDIYYANLSFAVGSEQNGIRPVLILQNDIGNRYSPTVIVAAITGHFKAKHLPVQVEIHSVEEAGLDRDSTILLEQLRTLDKSRLYQYVGKLDSSTMRRVDAALRVSIGLAEMDGVSA